MTSLPCDYSARSPRTTASFSRLANMRGKASPSAYFPKSLQIITQRSFSEVQKDGFQLVRRDDFKLRVGAIARLAVGAPPPELRHMTEARALHVLVRDFDYQLCSERLPR